MSPESSEFFGQVSVGGDSTGKVSMLEDWREREARLRRKARITGAGAAILFLVYIAGYFGIGPIGFISPVHSSVLPDTALWRFVRFIPVLLILGGSQLMQRRWSKEHLA